MKSEVYDFLHQTEKKHWWSQARAVIIEEFLDKLTMLEKGLTILDVGCGTGMMAERLQSFGAVTGVDPDGNALQYTRESSRGKVKVVEGSIPDNLPREKNFDVVVALDVLEHVNDDRKSLAAIRGVLAPRGLLVCTVPAYQFLWSPHDVIAAHKRRYTKKELVEKLEGSNFEVLKCSYFNTFLFPIALIFKIYTKMRWGAGGKAHIESVPPRIINTPFREIFSSERFFLPFMNFPFGVSIIAVVRKT